MQSSARPRTPGFVFGITALVLLVLLAALALTSRQPPPPTIAEFAPQAVENITDSPSDQSFAGAGAGGAAPTPTPEPELLESNQPIEVARVRKCVGDPPRQIEDPQSPPCVPYWEGDNGGATSKGVTRDEIIIAMPDEGDAQRRMALFFNKRFEFYGRKITLEPVPNPTDEPASQRAAAVHTANEIGAFASLQMNAGGGFDYYDELARQKVISAAQRPMLDEPYMAGRAPFMWQYQMALDRLMMTMGNWACARVGRGNAVHAGAEYVTTPRKFGVIIGTESESNRSVTPDPLLRELERCGVKPEPVFTFYGDGGDGDNASNAMLQMRSANVTTIFCFCHITPLKTYGTVASSQGYFPEWLLTGFILTDYDVEMKSLGPPAEQRAHAFGLTVQPMQRRPDEHPSFWAQKEMHPDTTYTNQLGLVYEDYEYQSMLVLASGIQMAGPRLTPETFQQALWTTRFPNPRHPIMAGNVGFGGRSHAMTVDAAEMWWSENHRSVYPDQGVGSWCYLNGGGRSSVGAWPSGPGQFFRDCDH